MTTPEDRKRRLGKRIRLLRDSRGLKAAQCVAMAQERYGIKVHTNTWSNIETGNSGSPASFAAVELVLRLPRGICQEYLDNGGNVDDIEPVVDDAVDELPDATPQQYAAALNRKSDADLIAAGIEEHDIPLIRALAGKFARQGGPGTSTASG